MASKVNGSWEVAPSETNDILLNTSGKYIDADIKIKKYTPVYQVENQVLKITSSVVSVNGQVLTT